MNANNGELFCPGKLPFLLGNLTPIFLFYFLPAVTSQSTFS